MRNVKDSGIQWIGEMPSHWSLNKGKYLLTLLQKPTKDDDGVITCFRDGEVTLRSNRREEGFTIAEKEIGYQGVDVGDLVVHGMDGFAGAIGISDSRGKASPVLNVLDSSQNKKYIMYYLRAMAYGGVFLGLATGIRVRSCDLRWNKLAETIFPVPPLMEQEQIVAYLDQKCSEIDALAAKINEEIVLLEESKNAFIHDISFGGLDDSVTLKKSCIDWVRDIPSYWAVKPLSLYFGERKNINSLNDETNLLSLSYGKVVRRDMNATSGLLPTSFSTYNIVEPDDIIIRPTDLQNDQKSLRTGLCQEHGIITSAYIALYRIAEINAAFVHYVLHAYDIEKVFYNMGSGVRQGLGFDSIKKLKIPVPPLKEQEEIVRFLDKKCDEIDEIIERKETQLGLLDSYKKSLIHEFVTGKKEVAQ